MCFQYLWLLLLLGLVHVAVAGDRGEPLEAAREAAGDALNPRLKLRLREEKNRNLKISLYFCFGTWNSYAVGLSAFLS